MGLFEPSANEEEQTEILHDIRTALANIAAQDGETQLMDELNNTLLHDYISVPENGDLLAMPAGKAVIDFDQGEVKHNAVVDTLTDDVSELGSLSGRSDELRSFSLGIDAPAKIRLNTGDWVAVDPGVYNVAAQRYSKLEVKSELPTAMNLMTSTRSQPFVSGDIDINILRTGAKSGTIDSYEAVDVFPRDLLNYLDEDEAQDSGAATIPNAGAERMSITVANEGLNDIDTRLMASPLGSDWFEIGAESLGISSGDHALFNISEAHNFLRVDIRNSTDGDQVAANVRLHGDP